MAEGGKGTQGSDEAGRAERSQFRVSSRMRAILTNSSHVKMICLLTGEVALLQAMIPASGECGAITLGTILSHVCRRPVL